MDILKGMILILWNTEKVYSKEKQQPPYQLKWKFSASWEVEGLTPKDFMKPTKNFIDSITKGKFLVVVSILLIGFYIRGS